MWQSSRRRTLPCSRPRATTLRTSGSATLRRLWLCPKGMAKPDTESEPVRSAPLRGSGRVWKRVVQVLPHALAGGLPRYSLFLSLIMSLFLSMFLFLSFGFIVSSCFSSLFIYLSLSVFICLFLCLFFGCSLWNALECDRNKDKDTNTNEDNDKTNRFGF